MAGAFYYLNADHQPVGPMEVADIRRLVGAGLIRNDVLISGAGGEDWKPLAEFEPALPSELNPVLPLTPPPPRHLREGFAPVTESGGAPQQESLSWLPLTSMITGLVALVSMCVPVLSLLLATPSLTLGILALQPGVKRNRLPAVTGVAAASVAVIGSLAVLLLGNSSNSPAVGREARAIEYVLKQDLELVRTAQTRYPNNAVEQARYVANGLQSIDTTQCPPDFRLAYQQHLNAWGRSLPYVAANTPINAFFEGLYAGYTQDYSVLGASDYQARQALAQVDETFRDVLNVAAFHGARIPSG